jgi:uncharacterized protein involved in exopolysaccharide biosynthesis
MEQYPPPQIEIFPHQEHNFPPPQWQEPWYRSRRFKTFSIIFLLATLISQAYNFSRPAVYRSSATLLTVAKASADQYTGSNTGKINIQISDDQSAVVEHVAIQKQLLLGSEILAETARKLQQTENITLSVPDIRQMLDVEPITDTNLVEMFAEGSTPEVLPLLINTWIDIYLKVRSKDTKQSTGTTQKIIRDELKSLREKVDLKRAQLDQFRLSNNISSTKREENYALARLKGLNKSLNIASEEEVKAKARLNAINTAIIRGQAVVPQEDQRTISALETRAQKLREQIAEMKRRFTQDYIDLRPSLKFVPLELEKLETRINSLRNQGKNIVLAEAQQAYSAAKQSIAAIQKQLSTHNAQASQFSSRFAEHDTLNKDLKGLELLHRESLERLAKLEATQHSKYPQVDVIDRAYLPRDSIRPNYMRDGIIALAGSLLLGLFSVWIAEFLTRKGQQSGSITVPGVHIHNQIPGEALGYQQQRNALNQQTNHALERPLETEFSTENLHKLYLSSSLKGRQLLVLLLSGLTLEEAVRIEVDDFDYANNMLSITGENPRLVPINTAIHTVFEQSSPGPLWNSNQKTEDLAALLVCLATDSGFPHPETFTDKALRHNYITYLLQQGLRLQDLEQIVGSIDHVTLSRYRHYSPPGPGRSVSEIKLMHPALVDSG